MIRPLMMKFLITTLGPDRGVYEHGAILVNKHGERFADELGNPNLKVAGQPDGVAYLVFDHRFAQKFSRWPHFVSTAPGVAFAFVDDYRSARPDLFHVGATPAHLANAVGFSGQQLQVAIGGANAGRPRRVEARHAAVLCARADQTVGHGGAGRPCREHPLRGVDEAGRPIPGLYAAGNAGQARLHGDRPRPRARLGLHLRPARSPQCGSGLKSRPATERARRHRARAPHRRTAHTGGAGEVPSASHEARRCQC